MFNKKKKKNYKISPKSTDVYLFFYGIGSSAYRETA